MIVHYHEHEQGRRPHTHDGYPVHIHEVAGELKGVYAFAANEGGPLAADAGDDPNPPKHIPAVIPYFGAQSLPPAPHDGDLHPQAFGPIDVVKAFQRALPGRSLGFGIHPNPPLM